MHVTFTVSTCECTGDGALAEQQIVWKEIPIRRIWITTHRPLFYRYRKELGIQRQGIVLTWPPCWCGQVACGTHLRRSAGRTSHWLCLAISRLHTCAAIPRHHGRVTRMSELVTFPSLSLYLFFFLTHSCVLPTCLSTPFKENHFMCLTQEKRERTVSNLQCFHICIFVSPVLMIN